jgi:4-hydroxy-3-polyprenylbenzoate decarboxylase
MQQFIKEIEKACELLRVKVKVNTKYEMAEITDRMSKQPGGGKALLFENNDSLFPVLMNALGSEKRMKIALRVNNFDDIGNEFLRVFKRLTLPQKSLFDKLKLIPELTNVASFMPKSVSGKGICQEVIHTNPDLSILPVLQTWKRDGGPFITLPQVITIDPISGIRNVGMYRMQIFEKKLTGMHWHKHKTGARHYEEYKKIGKIMPVAVAIGGDPVLTYAATAPLPDNIDEYLFAGFLRKKRVKLVKAITQDIYVPNEADFIIEGFVDPSEELILEGPFGDHTGFFSLADYYPKFHVTCITHKKNAVYPATVVGIPPMEDAWIAKATERIFLNPIKLTIAPELVDMNIPDAGVAHNLTLVSIKKSYPGQAAKTINALWGAGQMMFNKILVAFDENVKVADYIQACQILSKNVDPSNDIFFVKGPLDILDHSSSNFAYGSKLGIDATQKFPEENSGNAIQMTPENMNIDIDNIKTMFPEIKEININLLDLCISAAFISILKSKPGHIHKIADQIIKNTGLKNVKFIIFVDFPVNVFNIEQSLWISAGNLEPLRDCFIFKAENEKEISQIIFDGTRKRKDIDNFRRDWPDIVTSDNETIQLVNKRWDDYQIGPFIESPSVHYKPLELSKKAIVE